MNNNEITKHAWKVSDYNETILEGAKYVPNNGISQIKLCHPYFLLIV